MKPKMILKMGVDIVMTVALLLLMTYSLIGETAHEWIGIGMFVLFVLHHFLNRKWSRNILKGKYTELRILQTVFVLAVLICMAGSMISGIVLSRHVFENLPVYGGQGLARTVHMLCVYWGFVSMSLHLGFHWSILIGMASKAFTDASGIWKGILRVLAFVIAGYGVYAFIKRNVADYMFLRSHFVFFDYTEPLIFFILDYLAIMGMFVFAGHYLTEWIRYRSRGRAGKRDENKEK